MFDILQNFQCVRVKILIFRKMPRILFIYLGLTEVYLDKLSLQSHISIAKRPMPYRVCDLTILYPRVGHLKILQMLTSFMSLLDMSEFISRKFCCKYVLALSNTASILYLDKLPNYT